MSLAEVELQQLPSCFEDLFKATVLDKSPNQGSSGGSEVSALAANLFGPLPKPFENLLSRQFGKTQEILRDNATLLLYTVVKRYRQFLANKYGSTPQDAVFIRGATQRRERYSGEKGALLAAQLEHLSQALALSGLARGADDWIRKAFNRLNSQSDIDLAFYCPETDPLKIRDFWEGIRTAFGITNLQHVRVGEKTVDQVFQGYSRDGKIFFDWRERNHSGKLLHAYLYLFLCGGGSELVLDIALASPVSGDTRFGPFAQIRDKAGKLNLIPLDNGQLVYQEDTSSLFSAPEHDVAAACIEWPYFVPELVPDAISSALRGAIDLALWPPQQSVVNCDNGLGMASYQFENMQIGLMPTNYPLEYIHGMNRRRDEILYDVIRLMLVQDPQIFMEMIIQSNLFRIFPNLCEFIEYPYALESLAVAVFERQPQAGLEGLNRAMARIRPDRVREVVEFIRALQLYSQGSKPELSPEHLVRYLNGEDRDFVQLVGTSDIYTHHNSNCPYEFTVLQTLARLFLPGGGTVDTLMIKDAK